MVKYTDLMKKGVIFDLDGTLTLTQQFHTYAFASVFHDFRIPYDVASDFYHAGEGSRNTFPKVFAEYGVKDFDLEKCLAKKQKIYKEVLKTEKIRAVPGVKKFAEMLREKKIPYIVASGNRKEFVDQILKAASLKKLFSDIVTNHDVKHGKPAPDVFLLASSKIGVEPKDCLVFEDTWSGIKAAKAAGMYCAGLATGVPKEELEKAGADMAIRDFNDPRVYEIFNDMALQAA